jgi:predicted metal-dependent hydrolase
MVSRYGPFHTNRCDEPAPELLRTGIEQFNRGEYFEQHETIEILWRAEKDDVRYLYQGVLLVGVGLYHLKRGNLRGAVAKLETAARFLRWFRPSCQGVDVDALIADADRVRAAILALGSTRLSDFDWSDAPMVHLDKSILERRPDTTP